MTSLPEPGYQTLFSLRHGQNFDGGPKLFLTSGIVIDINLSKDINDTLEMLCNYVHG